MTTTIMILDPATLLARFELTETAIALLAKEYLPLKINGVNDTKGFEAVHSGRMDIKGKRVAVEKVRKGEKAIALDYGRTVDRIANRIFALLAPIESHLDAEEKQVQDEKDRIKNAAQIKAEAEARAKAEAEVAAMRAEQERLAAERSKLDAERVAMEAERAKIEAEARRLAQIEANRLRAEELEVARREAAEQSRIATEERLAREASERAVAERRRAEAKETARLRAETLRPDREKLMSVAGTVKAIIVPEVSVEAWEVRKKVQATLLSTAAFIENIASGLGGPGSIDDLI